MAAPLKLLESSRIRLASPFVRAGSTWPKAAAREYPCLKLENRLPINLRLFLSVELGPELRIEDDAIFALRPESEESVMRALARAIRRFSFSRAREPWVECAIPAAKLEAWLARALPGEYSVALCLRCERLSAGPDALAEHQSADCLALELGVAARSRGEQLAERAQAACVHHRLYEDIERLRRMRTAASLPHYDLDCFVRNGSVVFTWRPLPSA